MSCHNLYNNQHAVWCRPTTSNYYTIVVLLFCLFVLSPISAISHTFYLYTMYKSEKVQLLA